MPAWDNNNDGESIGGSTPLVEPNDASGGGGGGDTNDNSNTGHNATTSIQYQSNYSTNTHVLTVLIQNCQSSRSTDAATSSSS